MTVIDQPAAYNQAESAVTHSFNQRTPSEQSERRFFAYFRQQPLIFGFGACIFCFPCSLRLY